MLDAEEVFKLQVKQRKAIISANKTIVTLCKYITKLTDDERALRKAETEIKKAQSVLEREKNMDKLLDKITEVSCRNIAYDSEMTDEEKEIHIQGIQGVHERYMKIRA